MKQESANQSGQTAAAAARTNYRFVVLALITLLLTLSTADRATLSVAGVGMAKDLGISPVGMGYLFSAFSWAYVLGQVPAGWLGDKIGSKVTIFVGLLLWSLTTVAMGFVWPSSFAFMLLLGLRFLLGAFETPVGPSSGKIIAAWFPSQERGVAGSIFNSAQYLSLAIFTPLMGWLAYAFSWHYVYIVMGVLGVILAVVWQTLFHVPSRHPKVNQAELDYIREGGGLLEMDANIGKYASAAEDAKKPGFKFSDFAQLFQSRMLAGIFLAQYCVTAISWFYLSWFPIYLVKAKGFSILQAGFIASIPAIAGCIGGISSGFVSDWLLKKLGSLTLARKIPITIGFSLSAAIIICNYVQAETVVVALMSAAFFGKGFGNLGWTIVADTAPKKIVGITGGVFNSIGQASGIITPVVIGYILQGTGSFNGALVFVGAHGLVAIFSYWVIVGKIQRLELKP
ncbi:MAG: MFS transporter [Negativicutes bacterium]|nr:MFS transporter [Negativicutes bacterium]